MTVSPALLLKAVFLQLGVVTELSPPTVASAWPCYVGLLPDDPHSAIAIFDMGGAMDGRNQKTGEMFTHPGVHVQVRSQDYTLGYAQSCVLRDAMDSVKLAQVTVQSVEYQVDAVTRTSDVISMGQEREKRRSMFSIGAIVTIASTFVPRPPPSGGIVSYFPASYF